MSEVWVEAVPVLDHFAQVADPSLYAPLPDDWIIGLSDVIDSTGAIDAGLYKAVNLAGAATISAVSNALGGALRLFAFGGDGARFAVPPEHAAATVEALARVAAWAARDLALDLRVGTTTVAAARAAGFDVRAAFWPASEHVRYAMFTGGGLEWAETQMKEGHASLAPVDDEDPDLTGLSCQWGPIKPRQGKILSLIVKPVAGVAQHHFADVATRVMGLLDEAAALNPVPRDGPEVHWPSDSLALQSRVAGSGRGAWRRRLTVILTTAMIWLVFKFRLRIGGFEPQRYRREITANTDFRKFDDALMMTLDCSPGTVARLRALLDSAAAEGVVRYGLHEQDSALMTCVVPSVMTANHMHFVDGADGGYASAARQLRGAPHPI